MANAVTFTLDMDATKKLAMLSLRLGKNKSELVREMIKETYQKEFAALVKESAQELPEAA